MTQYDAILIRLGELFLKGANRHRFLDRLYETTRAKLAIFPALVLERHRDHFMIHLEGEDHEQVIKRLDLVFGIHSYALGRACDTNLDAIKATALPMAIEACAGGDSIKFETKRGWKKFPMTSIEVSRRVAEYVGDHAPADSVTFNVGRPDVVVRVFIKEERSLVVSSVIPASGGLPIGLNGRALLMLSGGLDSPVAGYLMMKRGLEVEGLHFESPPHTSTRARQKVFDLAEKLANYMPRGRFVTHVAPFTKLQTEIFANVPESYGMTVMRRMMYRVAAALAEKRSIHLLANGESLGQVASQTPASMWAINAVTALPVVRPVACMDKVEIMDLARKIDTYDISVRPYEDCCTLFVPKHPITNPKKDRCERYERAFDWEPMVEECVENTRVVEVVAGKPIAVDDDTTNDISDLL